MRFLIKTVETYRLRDEEEVEKFLQELKEDNRFTIVKYSSTKKTTKVKGEVVDDWIHFEVTKSFNDEKDPYKLIQVSYERENDEY